MNSSSSDNTNDNNDDKIEHMNDNNDDKIEHNAVVQSENENFRQIVIQTLKNNF
jgi:hypothetical protein